MSILVWNIIPMQKKGIQDLRNYSTKVNWKKLDHGNIDTIIIRFKYEHMNINFNIKDFEWLRYRNKIINKRITAYYTNRKRLKK